MGQLPVVWPNKWRVISIWDYVKLATFDLHFGQGFFRFLIFKYLRTLIQYFFPDQSHTKSLAPPRSDCVTLGCQSLASGRAEMGLQGLKPLLFLLFFPPMIIFSDCRFVLFPFLPASFWYISRTQRARLHTVVLLSDFFPLFIMLVFSCHARQRIYPR